MMRHLSMLLVPFFFVSGGSAQVGSTGPVETIAESMSTDEADLNYDDLYEYLSQIAAHPFNINQASREMLLSLNVLSSQQVSSILNYIVTNGELSEIYELQAIPLVELKDVQAILPYVRVAAVAPVSSFRRRVRDRGDGYFFSRYERVIGLPRGYRGADDDPPAYAGDPGRVYSRFRFSSPKLLSIGFTAEKDAGERWSWTSSQRGFDFYSGHVQFMNVGIISNLVAGDYTAQFGQGLTLGGGFGIGKGSETITTLRRHSTGFLPYSSANESGFFRGGAVTWSLPWHLLLHSFWSSLPRDASTQGSDEATTGSLSILQSGMHRTNTEIGGRRAIDEKNLGLALEWRRQAFEAGVVVHRTRFSQSLLKNPAPYNGFDFRGDRLLNTGVFGTWTIQNFSAFGEAARSADAGSAWLFGMLGSISRTLDVSVLVRSYDRDFVTFYSNALSESTAPKNEQGMYWGVKHAVSKRVSYTAYVDLFRFPWIRFRNYAPSSGSEWLVRVNYRLSRNVQVYAQFRDERKSRNDDRPAPEYRTRLTVRRNYIVHASVADGPLWLKTRVQYSTWTTRGTTDGFALALDAGYDWGKLSFSSRVAIFDSDDFDNRQYMNERDVLMAFSFPAYNGRGTRQYLVTRWQPAPWLDAWAKFGCTRYFGGETTGSGNEQLDGNTRCDIKLEVVFRF